MSEYDLTDGELGNLMEKGLNHDCRMSALAARRLVADAARDKVFEKLRAKGLHVTCWGEPVVGQKIPREAAAGTFLFIPDEAKQ